MPRQLAGQRQIAIGRQPIPFPRRVVGFINDGKPHIIIDTNVFIDALEAKRKGNQSNEREKACLQILETWEKGLIVVGINHYLYSEYTNVSNRLVKEGRLSGADVSKYLGLAEKSTPHRVLVDQISYSPHKKDDILFDGLLNANYLISSNWKDVSPDRLTRQISTHMKIMKPEEFLTELKNLSIVI